MEKWSQGDLVRCTSAGKFSFLGRRGPQKGQLLRVIDVVSNENEAASLLFEQWPQPYPAQRFSKITLDEQRALAAEFVSQINHEVGGGQALEQKAPDQRGLRHVFDPRLAKL